LLSDYLSRKQFAESVFTFGLFLLAASLPLSEFGMSISQFFLFGGWILSGSIFNKFKKAFSDKAVLALCGFYLLHVVGSVNSSDYQYLLKDLRIKLPLFTLPVLLSTAPFVHPENFKRILFTIVIATLISTLISIGVWCDILPHHKRIDDIRDISIFISHIRLSLLICFSVFVCCWFLIHKTKLVWKILLGSVILWFLSFMYVLESMTGFIILMLASLFLILKFSTGRRSLYLRAGFMIFALAFAVSLFFYIKKESESIYRHQTIDFNALEKSTINGNAYSHFPDMPDQENGNLVWIYVCEPELERAWNYRSTLEYSGQDLMKQPLKYTLIRFLASKELRKDSAGVFALTDDEINSIENGIANVEYQKSGSLRIRIRKTIQEFYLYKTGANPSGSSLLQRWEYWKAGWNIFMRNKWTGVGTGDVPLAFQQEYNRVDSPLTPETRHRAHNQYLTIALTFGIFGAGYFLFSLFYPVLIKKKTNDFIFMAFFSISLLSMITEDTLETQPGVSFYAFLNSFLLFMNGKNSPHSRGG